MRMFITGEREKKTDITEVGFAIKSPKARKSE